MHDSILDITHIKNNNNNNVSNTNSLKNIFLNKYDTCELVLKYIIQK